MSIVKVTWYPAALPSATPLVFDTEDGAALRLLHMSGTGPLALGMLATKGPGQAGERALDVTVPPRFVILQALIDTASWNEFWDARSEIARAMVGIPVRFGSSLERGRLLFERDGESNREIYAVPRSAPIEVVRGAPKGIVDAEFYCDYPYFQPTSDTTSAEIAVDDSETIANAGDVDAPFIARIYGPATEVSLTNLTSGEIFTVTVTLADDTEWLEVDTTMGRKRVRKYTDVDTWENAIAGLSTAESQLWLLRPGNNSVKLEAVGDTVDTHAVLTFRPRYAAI